MSPGVPELEGTCHRGSESFFEDVPSVEFIFPVFVRMPGGDIVCDSGLCCCVPYLMSAVTSLRLLIVQTVLARGTVEERATVHWSLPTGYCKRCIITTFFAFELFL